MLTLRRLRLVSAAAAVALAVLAGPAGPASAHASLVGTEPADGSVTPNAPSEIVLHFDESVRADLAEVTMTDASSQRIELAPLVVASSSRALTATPLRPLPDGVYRLAYKVRDPVDLHLASGSVVFGVGKVTVTAAGGDAAVAPPWTDVLARWLERAALALMVGASAVLLLVVPRAGAGRVAAGRVLRIVRRAALLQCVALAAQLGREVVDIGPPYGRTLGRLLGSGAFGRRLGAAVVVVGALALLTRLLEPLVDDALLERWRRGRFGELGLALGVMAVAACLILALAGHSSTGGAYAVGVLVRLLHLVSMGAWAGGLVTVALLWRTVERPGRLVAAFSPVALAATGILVVTGLVLTGREVDTVTALLTSWFGRLLLAKLAVLALAAVWGIRHARAVDRARPVARRGVRVEAALAVGLVLGGAALSATQPAVGARYDRPRPPTPPPPALTIDDVTVKLTLRPNRPGTNLLTATVASSRRPDPAPITGVSVDFRSLEAEGLPVKAEGPAPDKGAVDLGQIQLSTSGHYQVEVQVVRPGAPLKLALFDWTVDPIQQPRVETLLSDATLWPYTSVLAAASAVVAIALVVRRRRRGWPVPPADDPADQPAASQAGRAAS